MKTFSIFQELLQEKNTHKKKNRTSKKGSLK